MESLIREIMGGATGIGSYGIIVAMLLLCGLGVPIPEDVLLITGGYLVYSKSANLELMIVVTYLGILGGDSIAYALGRHFGHRLERIWPFRLFITAAKRERVERLFGKYGQKIVMAARFMPGVRAVTYFLAGSARMSFLRFLIFDGLAALVSAPLFVLLGYHLGENIEAAFDAARQGQGVVIALLALLLAGWLGFRYFRKRKAQRLPPSDGV